MRVVSLKTIGVLLAALSLAGCSHQSKTSSTTPDRHHGFASAATDPFAGKGSPYYNGGKIPFGGGRYHVGSPYQVAGRWFTPKEQSGYDKTGVASWYGEAFHRRKTANGEWFDMNTLTAASATLPLPSYALVTNLENNKQVVVRINDRGPFVGTRLIDLSKRAADELGYRHKGKTNVRVKLIGPAPIKDSMRHMMAMNQAAKAGAGMGQLVAMSNDTSAQAPLTQVAAAALAPEPVQQVAYQPPANVAQAYMVRVAIFHSIENASEAYNQVVGAGPTQIIKAVGANGPLYRVQIGPFNSAEEAQVALQTAMNNGFESARVVETQPLQISMK
jgi:rare lipoprotein A